MSGYIGNIPTPQATQTRNVYTAASGQTTFGTSGYTPGFLDVFLNGVHLVDGTDYTASNGSEVVLTTGAAAGDNLEVVAYTTFSLSDNTFPSGLTVDNANATVLTVDRATSDGTIIDLQKDGSTIGEIGVDSSNFLYIGKPNQAGLKFQSGNIIPVTGGVNANNTYALGGSATKFTNLYLSGGVYLGGTGAANYLDDYEEGTWTVTDVSGVGISITTNKAYYRKSGAIVVARFSITIGGNSSTTAVDLSLPFTSDNNGFYAGEGMVGYTNITSSKANGLHPVVENAGTSLLFYYDGTTRLTYQEVSGVRIDATIVYSRT